MASPIYVSPVIKSPEPTFTFVTFIFVDKFLPHSSELYYLNHIFAHFIDFSAGLTFYQIKL